MGIVEPGLNRAIRRGCDLLGWQSFFTIGEDEVWAWTVSTAATAPEAAGTIHSDLQKGLIRAEVIHYDDAPIGGILRNTTGARLGCVWPGRLL